MPVTVERITISIAIAFALVLLLATSAFLVIDAVAKDRAVDAARKHMSTIVTLRKRAANVYFESILTDIEFLAQSPKLRSDLLAFSNAWRDLDGTTGHLLRETYQDQNDGLEPPTDGGFNTLMFYKLAHADIHERTVQFLQRGGYDDLLMIDAGGNVVYSVKKGPEYGTNLVDGPYSKTKLRRSFDLVKNSYLMGDQVFTDFFRYEPRGGAPAAFIVVPVESKNSRFIGAIAISLAQEPINAIAQYNRGLGDGGRIRFVGEDYLMRNQMRGIAQQTLLETKVKNDPVIRAMNGRSGVATGDDEAGNEIMIAYTPLLIKGVTWAVVAERSIEAIVSKINRTRNGFISLIIGLTAATIIMVFLIRPLMFANRGITTGDIKRIKASWERIDKHRDDFARAMFERLFERDPALRGLFHSKIDKHAHRFAEMLNHLIKNLDKFEKIRPQLQRMGRDHLEYGARVEHFEAFGATFLSTIKDFRGHRLTRQERDSWADLFATIAQEMAISMR